MHRRICALGLLVLLLCGVAIGSGGASSAADGAGTREPTFMAVRAHQATAGLTTSRTSRERLPSLLAVLAALVLVAAAAVRAHRAPVTPRRIDAASTYPATRAPPPPLNLAF